MIKFASFHIAGFDFRVTKVGDNYESCTILFYFIEMGNMVENQLRWMVVGPLPIYKTNLMKIPKIKPFSYLKIVLEF
jgi:hypothetical protein